MMGWQLLGVRMRAKSIFFWIFQIIICSSVFAEKSNDNNNEKNIKVSQKTAEKIAIQEFKRQTKANEAMISVRQLKGDEQEWAFVLEDSAQMPRPGSELYVRVNKRTAEITSYFGK
jgi:uncharacterized membrane protein